MKKYLLLLETITDDFATNQQIETALQELPEDDRVLVLDGLEVIQSHGDNGISVPEWASAMRSIHTQALGNPKMREIFKWMMDRFPHLIRRDDTGVYIWQQVSRRPTGGLDSDHAALMAAAQIRFTGQILDAMREMGRFTAKEVAQRISGLDAYTAEGLVHHVITTMASTIKPEGAGYYVYVPQAKPKTPSEHMNYWRDLAKGN